MLGLETHDKVKAKLFEALILEVNTNNDGPTMWRSLAALSFIGLLSLFSTECRHS